MNEHSEATIHVVDDDASIRVSLSRLLTQAGYPVKVYKSAGDFLVSEPDASPGCLLLDLELEGPNGLELQHVLQRHGNPTPVVFMSAYHDIPRTVLAIKAGASDFLLKPIDCQTLLSAIETALAAGTCPTANSMSRSHNVIALSEREKIVLRGVVAGRLNKQIAADLDLSERTIKSCRAEIMRKHCARSIAELVRLTAHGAHA